MNYYQCDNRQFMLQDVKYNLIEIRIWMRSKMGPDGIIEWSTYRDKKYTPKTFRFWVGFPWFLACSEAACKHTGMLERLAAAFDRLKDEFCSNRSTCRRARRCRDLARGCRAAAAHWSAPTLLPRRCPSASTCRSARATSPCLRPTAPSADCGTTATENPHSIHFARF